MSDEEHCEQPRVETTLSKLCEERPPETVDPFDDPLHVPLDEGQWIWCIPKLSLTGATLLFALIGIGIGLAIALSPPHTVTVDTTETVNRNITQTDITNTTNIDTVYDMQIMNGQIIIFYTESVNVTREEPYSHLNKYAYAIIEFPGKLWISALKLLVLPLIVMMMIVLPSRVDNVGPLGAIAIPLYLFTSCCAALQGTLWAWIVQPGNLGKQDTSFIGTKSGSDDEILITDAIFQVIYNAVPPNIIAAMSSLTMLGIIVFFLVLGTLLRRKNVKDEERDAVINASHAVLRCCMLAIVWVVWFTPIGMLSLICLKIAATTDLVQLVSALGYYILCVVLGHSVHTFLFYPLLFWFTTRLNPYSYYIKIFAAPLLAFATSSSAATLPRSLQVAEAAGVSKEVISFVIPLGAAINMDGTALGFPIMIGLIAQLNGISLDIGKIIVVMILAVIVSIGTAPIPNVGMVYLTMLFEAAGIGEYAGEGIATLFVLDWLVDRIETAVNVTSDQFVCKMTDVIDLRNKNSSDTDSCDCCSWCCFTPDEHQGYQRPPTDGTEMM
eukprot:84186_1